MSTYVMMSPGEVILAVVPASDAVIVVDVVVIVDADVGAVFTPFTVAVIFKAAAFARLSLPALLLLLP